MRISAQHLSLREWTAPGYARRPTSIAVAGVVSLLVAVATARASPPEWQMEGGVFLAYHYGAHSAGKHFGFGIEARALHARRPTLDCAELPARSLGAVGRVMLVGGDQVRVTVGARAGVDDSLASAGAELAAGYRLGREPGPLVQIAGETAFGNTAFLRLVYTPSIDTIVGFGAWFPQAFAGCEAPAVAVTEADRGGPSIRPVGAMKTSAERTPKRGSGVAFLG